MAGKDSTQQAKSSVLDAMMDDLGNNRIEDLLDGEDNRNGRHRLAASANTTNATKSTEPRKSARDPNSLAGMYRAAIENGEFDDDDAAGVQGLDSLDNGNAHRVKSYAVRSSFVPMNQKRTNDATGSFPKRPKYDPSNPTYRISNSKRPASNANTLPRAKHPSTTFNEGPRVSSLGGIIPDGGDVKKWDNTKRLTVPNLPAGRGRPVNGQKYPPLGPTVGRGHGNSGFLPDSLQKIDNQIIGAEQPITSRQLPHLRKATENQSIASQVPAIPHQGLPSLTEVTAKVIALDQASNFHNLTTLDPREIFFQGDVLMPNQIGVGGDKPAKGRIVIYELLATPIGVWEITVEGRKVIRGDVRELLEILPDGSKVFLRRWPNKTQVRSEPLRFSNVTEAEIFTFEANIRRLQYTNSSEPIQLETSFDLSPVQDVVTPSEAKETPKKAMTPETAINPTKTSGSEVDGFERTIREKEEEDIKRMKEEAEMKAKRIAEEVAEKVKSCLVWSRPEKSDLDEPKLVGQTAECVQPKVEPQSQTLPVSLTTGLVVPTPTKAGTNHHTRTGSGWSDSDLINLSPDSASGSRYDFKQSETAESCTTLGVETSKRLLPGPHGGSTSQAPCFVSNRAPLKRTETDAVEEVIRALRDVKVLEGVPASEGRSGDPLHILRGDSAYYETLVRKSRLLALALEGSSGQTLNTAFVASLLHLVELDEFLNLSHEDQKKSLAALYTVVCRCRPRITRTSDEIRALRSGWETCPQAIRDFNALVRGGWAKGHRRSSTNDSMSFLTDRLKALSVRHYQG
ncbi:hypothetical protein GGR51DRAFT_575841 [Nemania sp. FL0031]|nr:hypothetical protein GGR51DRAFT_575841 [Nemania sp. FL0031]